MGSEREHRRAHERAIASHGERMNRETKRLISPMPNERFSLFTFDHPGDTEYTFVRTGVRAKEAEDWLYAMNETIENQETQTDRIMATGRTQPLTPVEKAFFDVPDHMAKPRPDEGRVPINIAPRVKRRLHTVLSHDSRFRTIGYSEFITRALDALGAE